jgi:hypothetical protein
VLAVGLRVVMANPPMQALLEPGDQEALQDHVRFLMLRHATVDEPVELPSGILVRLRGSAVRLGTETAGMIGIVSLLNGVDGPAATAAPPGRPPPRASPTPNRVLTSRSPAWCAAVGSVRAALAAGEPILVLGEPGTGRFTLLAELHRLRYGVDRTVAVPAGEIEAAPAEIAARLLRPAAEPTLHVLRDVDRLTPAAAQTLAAELARAPDGPPGFAATAAEPGPHPDLLRVFRASAMVPPLRHRGADLATLVAGLLADLAPHRDVRLSPEALRLLGSYRWPGNVGQLRDALAAALTRRPVGVIQVPDLPAFCQSSPRSALRPVDEIERDAIVTALRDANGNRVAAATALGLARSTLYRKIRQYGITV